jgi:hypothetical protein
MEKYKKAFRFYKSALEIYAHSIENNRLNIGMVLNNLSALFRFYNPCYRYILAVKATTIWENYNIPLPDEVSCNIQQAKESAEKYFDLISLGEKAKGKSIKNILKDLEYFEIYMFSR